MNRRSFLGTLTAIALSPILCRANTLEIKVPVKPKSGWEWVENPYPKRFYFIDGKYVEVTPFKSTYLPRGILTELNPAWKEAPYQDEFTTKLFMPTGEDQREERQQFWIDRQINR